MSEKTVIHSLPRGIEVKVNFLKEQGILTVTLKNKGEVPRIITSEAFVLITLLDGEIADIEIHLDRKAAKELAKLVK